MGVEGSSFSFVNNRMVFLILICCWSASVLGGLNKTNHEAGRQAANSTFFGRQAANSTVLMTIWHAINGSVNGSTLGRSVNNTNLSNASHNPEQKRLAKNKGSGLSQKKGRKDSSRGYKNKQKQKNSQSVNDEVRDEWRAISKDPTSDRSVCNHKTVRKVVAPERNKQSPSKGLRGKAEFYLYVYRRFKNGTFVDDDFTDKNNTEILNEIRHRPVYLCKAKINIKKFSFTKKNIEKIEIIAYGTKQERGLSWHQWNGTENSAELLQEYKEKVRGRNPVVMIEGCCIDFEQEVQLMGLTARHNQNVAAKDNANPLFLTGIVWPTTRYYRKDGSYYDDIRAFKQDDIIADNAPEPMREILNTIVDDARIDNDTVPKISVVAHSRGGANIMAMLRKGDLPDYKLSSLNLVSSDLSEKYFQSGGQPLFTDSEGVLQRWVCSQGNTSQESHCASDKLYQLTDSISNFYSEDDTTFSSPKKIPALYVWWYEIGDQINKTSDAIGGRPFSKPGAQPDFVSDRSLGVMESRLSLEAQEGKRWDESFSGGHGNMYWNEPFNEDLFRTLREQSPADLMDFCYQTARNITIESESTSVNYITQRIPIKEGDCVYGFYEGSLSRSAYNDSAGRDVPLLGWGSGVVATEEQYFPVTGIKEPCVVRFKDYQVNNTKEHLIERLKGQMQSAPDTGLLLYIGDDESVTRSMQLSVIYKRLGGNVTTLLYAPPGAGVRDKEGFQSTKLLASASKKQTAAVLDIAFQAVQAVGGSARLYLVCKGTGGYFLKAGLESLLKGSRASSFLKDKPIKSVILPASLLTASELERDNGNNLYKLIEKLLSAEGRILVPYGSYNDDWDNRNQFATQLFQCDNPETHYGPDLCYSSGLDVLPGSCSYSGYPVSAYFETQNCIESNSVKPCELTVSKRFNDYNGDLRELYDPKCRNEIKFCLSPSADFISYTEVPAGESALNMTVFPTSSVPSDEYRVANRTAGADEKEVEEYTVEGSAAVTGSTSASPSIDQNATTVQDRVTVVTNYTDKEKLSTVYTVPLGAGIDAPEEKTTGGLLPSATDKSTVTKGTPVLPVAIAGGGAAMLLAIAGGCYYCRAKKTSSFCVSCHSVFCEDCSKRFEECCQPGVSANKNTVKFEMGSGNNTTVASRLAGKDIVSEESEVPETGKMLKDGEAAETSL